MSDRESDDSDSDMEEDVTDEETKALLEEAGADAADGRPIEVEEERPEDLIIVGKRRRTPVDYKILNFVSLHLTSELGTAVFGRNKF